MTPTILFGQFDKNKIVEIGSPENAAGVSEVRLSGTIRDNTGETLPGATVQLQGTDIGTTTDKNGNYSINIPPGIRNVIFSFVGMEKRLITFVIFKNGKYDIVMEPDNIQLEQVTIEAEPDKNVMSVMPGVERVEIEEIKTIPTFLGEVDVIRSLQLLPGVATVGEGSGGFNVRGGKADQNLILFNNSQIFNSSHILGFFSAFNPEVVESFSLYKGYIPARFGGRVSSVLDVEMKDGNREKIKTSGSVGIISSSLVLDGPLWEGASFVLGGRTSYSDWILSTVKDPAIRNSNAYFNDINIGFSQRIGDNHMISLSHYQSNDNFEFDDNFSFDWQNRNYSFDWLFSINDWLVSKTIANYGQYRSSQTDPEGADAAKRSIGINFTNIKQNFLISALKGNEINLGVEYTRYDNQPETIEPFGESSGVGSEVIEQGNGEEYSFYIDDEIEISKKLKVAAGLRFTQFRNIGPGRLFTYDDNDFSFEENIVDTLLYDQGEEIASYNGLEPRLSLRYSISEASSIKLSYVRVFQYLHSISNTTAPTPTDLWKLSNPYIRPLRSDNYSIGYFQNFKNNIWEFSSELFYRNMENLLDFRDFADLVANEHIETELLQGDGRSYGLEVQLKKKENEKRWSGWLSYTYSRSEIQIESENLENSINNGNWFPTNFDRPHNLVLVSKLRLGNKSSFDASFTYNTGRPITAIETAYNLGEFKVPNFSDRNKYRIPDYIRLDVGFTIAENIWKNRKEGYQFRRYKDKLTISFYNVLGRRNAYSVFFIRPNGLNLIPQPHQFSVLGNVIPALSYQFKF